MCIVGWVRIFGALFNLWAAILTYDEIVGQTRSLIAAGKPVAPSKTNKLLDGLRQHREFDVLREFSEFLIQLDPENATASKLYAQALIDSGSPGLGRDFLTAALARTSSGNLEHSDMQGVLGRANKDIATLNLLRKQKDAAAKAGRAALEAYNAAYMADKSNTYHGINVAALSTYLKSHKIDIGQSIDPNSVAKDIIDQLSAKPVAQRAPWDSATLAEAHVPLGNWRMVEGHLTDYLAHPDTGAFQIGGTLRQFRDIWEIGTKGKDGEGARILKLLEASYLQMSRTHHGEESHTLQLSPAHVRDVANTPADDAEEIESALEKTLGATGTLSFDWYQTGAKRAMSVASVVTDTGRRKGTSFAVDNRALGLEEPEEGVLYMMTNFHVLNSKGTGALSLDEAHVRFEAMSNTKFKAREIVFEDSYIMGGLDATVFKIECDEKIAPIPFDFDKLDVPIDGDRVYVIGYPEGGELRFSLQDNFLLDHECADNSTPPVERRRLLHYFAPTEPGNSGSPVFDEEWRCIALHHAGKKHDPPEQLGMKMLNGKVDDTGNNRYSANEGIWITSIKSALPTAGS